MRFLVVLMCVFVGCKKSRSNDTEVGSAAGLQLPQAITAVPANEEGSIARALVYEAAPQYFVVDLAPNNILAAINFTICAFNQLGLTELAEEAASQDATPYLAAANYSECSWLFGAPRINDDYATFVVTSSREPGEPHVVQLWESSEGDYMQKTEIVIEEGPSESNPFGVFAMASRAVNEELEIDDLWTVDTSSNDAGEVRVNVFYEFTGEQFSATIVGTPDHGLAFVADETGAYLVAYNDSNVLVQQADTADELPFLESGSSSGTCLSRDDVLVYPAGYDLFDAATGERAEVNYTVGFLADCDGNLEFGTDFGRGYNISNDCDLTQLSSVEGWNPSTAQFDTYDLHVAPGYLERRVERTVSLADVGRSWLFLHNANLDTSDVDNDGVDDSSDNDIDPAYTDYTGWRVELLNGEFKLVEGQTLNEDSAETFVPLPEPLRLPKVFGDYTFYFSGGLPIVYADGDTTLHYSETSVVEADDILFAEQPSLTLTCENTCPDGYDDGDTVDFAQEDLTLRFAGEAVVAEDLGEGVGLGFGPLSVGDGATYMWWTGLALQKAILRNAEGVVLHPDPWMWVPYQHTASNDRNGDDAYEGLYVLIYKGKDFLVGLPEQVAVKDGTSVGDGFIIKASVGRHVPQEVDDNQCSDLTFEGFSAADIPTSGAFEPDVSATPEVSGLPRVVAGQLAP